MEVGNNEVAVLLLHINGDGGVHDASKASDHEHRDEAKCEKHRRVEAYLASPHGADPVENFHSSGNGDEHGQHGESGGSHDSHACREHVVTPYGETHEADDCSREHHQPVAEKWLARECGDDF